MSAAQNPRAVPGDNSGDAPAPAVDASSVSRDQLKSFIERIERLQEEKANIASDIKDVFAEAKGTGFDTKALRKLLSIRKKDHAEMQEEMAILQLYADALGMGNVFA